MILLRTRKGQAERWRNSPEQQTIGSIHPGVYIGFATRLFNPTTIRKTKRTLSNMEVSLIEKESKSNNSNNDDIIIGVEAVKEHNLSTGQKGL